MLFDLFIVFGAHCIGDYPLQGSYLAKGKRENEYLLLCHSAIYTLCIVTAYAAIAFKNGDVFYTVPYGVLALLVFITHLVVDALTCEARDWYDTILWPPFTSDYVKRAQKNTILYVDQIVHMFFNWVILAIFLW